MFENCFWKSWSVTKLQDVYLQLYPHLPSCIWSSFFLKMHQDYFFRRGFESVWAQFLSGNISLISRKLCYLLFTCSITIHPSQGFSCWIRNLTAKYSLVQFLSSKLEFFVSYKNIKITRISFSFCSIFWYVLFL